MNTRAIVGVALTGVVVLVSCTQDQRSAPVAPTQASFIKANPNACDFTVTRASAKEYFADLKDPIYGLIDAMQAAHKAAGGGTAGDAAATDEGFAVIAQTASYLGNSSKIKGTPAQGSAFVNDVFQCMSVAGYSPSVEFSMALSDTGLFKVVDQNDITPVTARYNVGNSPAFGAEPKDGDKWPVTSATLFYGANVSRSLLSKELVQGTVADIKSLPVYSSFAREFKAGACKVTDPYARALHEHTINGVIDATILPPVKMSFCIGNDDVLGSASGPTSSFALGLKHAAGWFAPRPLYAAAMPTSFGGGGAGLVDGLSEIGPVSFTSVVSFVTFPKTIRLSKQPQTFTVLNETANHNPLAGVTITLTVVGNSGSFTNPPIGNTAVTNHEGIATFDKLFLDKSGGYTITANSPLGGSASATFNVTGN